MKKSSGLFVMGMTLWFSLNLISAVHGQAPAASPQLDTAKLTDPKTKAAVEEINKKQALIKEVIIEDMKALNKDAKGEIRASLDCKILERRPNGSYRYAKSNGGMTGDAEIYSIQDGKYVWEVQTLSAATVEKMLENAKKQGLPQAQIDSMASSMKGTHISKIDLAKLQQAGVLTTYQVSEGSVLRPLDVVEPASLKLASETPAAWTFTANPKSNAPSASAAAPATSSSMAMTLVINKANGICAKMEIIEPTGTSLVTMDKITVNPAPPIPDSYFTYTPAADVSVTDSTDAVIKALAVKK